MFTEYPNYPIYRTLEYFPSPNSLRGEDVYALQTALNFLKFDVGEEDGILGKQTAAGIVAAQKDLGLAVDGKAGGLTQRGIALRIASYYAKKLGLPDGLYKGQLEFESGYRLGIYSPLRADGSYDIGVAQENTKFLYDVFEGYVVHESILALGNRVLEYYQKFAGVTSNYRRWQLAQGSWNAPAYACYLANQAGASVPKSETKAPSSSALQTFNEYVAHVSTYLVA